MILPLIAAAVAIGAVGSIIKDIGSSNAKEKQLNANDNALRISEEHNADQAQQARLAVMGGAFSGGSFNNYINQQLYYSNADLVAKRSNISAEKSAIRANEIGTAVGAVGKAILSYANASSALSLLKQTTASVAHRAISSSLESKMLDAGEGMTSHLSLEGKMLDAGEGMASYLSRGGSFGLGAPGLEASGLDSVL